MRGRRPSPSSVELNPQTQAVQQATDDVVLLLLAEFKKKIAERISKGDLDDVKLTTLTKELRGLLHSIKKPNSTLNYMAAPQLPQSGAPGRRDKEMVLGVEKNRDRLLASQESFLENNVEE